MSGVERRPILFACGWRVNSVSGQISSVRQWVPPTTRGLRCVLVSESAHPGEICPVVLMIWNLPNSSEFSQVLLSTRRLLTFLVGMC